MNEHKYVSMPLGLSIHSAYIFQIKWRPLRKLSPPQWQCRPKAQDSGVIGWAPMADRATDSNRATDINRAKQLTSRVVTPRRHTFKSARNAVRPPLTRGLQQRQ